MELLFKKSKQMQIKYLCYLLYDYCFVYDEYHSLLKKTFEMLHIKGFFYSQNLVFKIKTKSELFSNLKKKLKTL